MHLLVKNKIVSKKQGQNQKRMRTESNLEPPWDNFHCTNQLSSALVCCAVSVKASLYAISISQFSILGKLTQCVLQSSVRVADSSTEEN